MKHAYWLYIFLCIPGIVQAEVSFKERLHHFAKGSAQCGFAAANLYLIYNSGKIVYEEFKKLSPHLENFVPYWQQKSAAARWELFRQAIAISSFSYVSRKCFKHGIDSFKKAFKKDEPEGQDKPS